MSGAGRNRSALGGGAIAALALLFVGLTVVSGFALRGFRLDLTQNRLYTIAPGTLNIVKGLGEPVTLNLFLSAESVSELPQVSNYATRVREFLDELVARSGGKLRLNVIDPQPFSEDEDRASELGIRAVPLGGAGRQLYFGVAGSNSTDGKGVIDFLDPAKEQFLEYDVAKLIQQLGTARKPVIGWLSTLPMEGGVDPATGQPAEPWLVLSQAQQLFDVRTLGDDLSALGKDIDVLVVVHPKGLKAAAQFAIDQYALAGGRVLMFVDPLAESDTSAAEPGNPLAALGASRASDAGPLLAAWGVDFDPAVAVGDLEYGITVSMQPGDPPTRHIGILGLDARAFSTDDVTTAILSSLNVASSGFLAPRKGATTRFEPLLQTSTQAGPLPVARFEMLMDPATLRDGFKPLGRHLALAARVSGPAKSAFPDGPPAGAATPGGAPVLKQSAKPLNVIVVADTDMLADFLWVRQQNFFGQRVAQAWANNGDFVWNALENLAGSGDLISVRGRASFRRPFERVEALRRSADDRIRAKEIELEQELEATDQKLTALQSQSADNTGLILTPEQEAELQRFQGEKLRIRRELRDVRLGLDQEIEALGNRLKVLNIIIVPVVLASLALAMAFWRRRRHAAIVSLQRDRSTPDGP